MLTKQSFNLFTQLVCCFCLCPVSYSQNPKYFNYSVEQGLPSSETYDVIQDSKGYIWIGTDRGVVRYNGYEFKLFTTNDGLSSNTIFRIVEDEKGRLWFLSFHSHLTYFENGKIKPYRFNHVLEKHIKGTPNPRSIYVDKDSGIYIGYDIIGLVHIDNKGNFKKLSEYEKNIFYSCFNVKKGKTILFGSFLSEHSSRNIQVEFTDGKQTNKLNKDIKTIGEVYHISSALRKNGTVVTATSKKMISFNVHEQTTRAFPIETIVSRLYEDNDSCLWVCQIKKGVQKLFPHSSDPVKQQFNLLEGKSVTGVLQDHEGGFWFTTLESGVYYFPQFMFTRAVTPMNRNTNEVTTITGDGHQKIFVGYNKGLIEEMNGLTYGKTYYPNKLKDSLGYIYSLLYDSSTSKLWCGSNHSLCTFDAKGDKKEIYSGITRAIFKKKNEELLFFEIVSLVSSKNGRETTLIPEILSVYIEDICTDNNNNVMMASPAGLYLFNSKKKLHHPKNFLATTRVKQIVNPGDGRIFYATLGKGIVVQQKNKLSIIDEKKGLASNFVNSIINDSDTIWAATTKGISRIILTNKGFIISNFDQYNGLPTNEIKKIYKQGSHVWLGTKQGLYCFDANKISVNRSGPKVILDEILVNEKPAGGQNKFSSNQNNLKFDFFALDYNMRGNINYRYRLIGYNNKWQYTKNRSVSYLSLPNGEYCFELQAQNEDKYWSIFCSSFSFVVFKPFYLEWWFIAVCFLFLVTVVYTLVRRRIASIRHNNKVSLLMNEYKGIALASQINPHFIFNSLNSIQSFIMHEDRVSASKYLSSFAQLMRKSLEHSRIDFVSISDEIELLNTYLTLEQLRFKNKFGYQFHIDELIDQLKTQIPSMILQPFIENSVKHGLILKKDPEGIVTIRLFFEGALLKCEIEDNGVGRQHISAPDKENKKHISHGIDITIERIKTYCRNEKMKFFFDIEDKFDSSGKPAGTKVVFYLPYKKLV